MRKSLRKKNHYCSCCCSCPGCNEHHFYINKNLPLLVFASFRWRSRWRCTKFLNFQVVEFILVFFILVLYSFNSDERVFHINHTPPPSRSKNKNDACCGGSSALLALDFRRVSFSFFFSFFSARASLLKETNQLVYPLQILTYSNRYICISRCQKGPHCFHHWGSRNI